jgi:hypothetical protein
VVTPAAVGAMERRCGRATVTCLKRVLGAVAAGTRGKGPSLAVSALLPRAG